MVVFQCTLYYRNEKPYGVGRTANERHSYIVAGWRGEVISGLRDYEMIYTGSCATKEECKQELITHLRNRGYSGILRCS